MNYVIRLISSEDHDISQDELVKIISETGRDWYNDDRKHIFHDFYGKYNVDFFAEYRNITEENLESKIKKAAKKFPLRTKGDRGKAVSPNIVIIYDASKCSMIRDVYDYMHTSDCFKFIGDPKEALVEVRKI